MYHYKLVKDIWDISILRKFHQLCHAVGRRVQCRSMHTGMIYNWSTTYRLDYVLLEH